MGLCTIKEGSEIIDSYLKRLFPICRSITGDGVRETLHILQEIVPIKILEYSSGQRVYDWVIPKEWNIRDAWIKNRNGEKIVDFKHCNLHIVSYSRPIHKTLPFSDLKNHLFYREDLPEAIPYRTTYYQDFWGFCLSYQDFCRKFVPDQEYEVYIDSTLTDGSLTVGELLIPGKLKKEYLISTYICHPSLANDNVSGMILTALLARELLNRELNFSYRILFLPETIGAIAYCAHNEQTMKGIDCGLVVTTVGGSGKFGYKQSWDENHEINRIIEYVFQRNGIEFIKYPFDVLGSDERQFSSPGFRINVATICKDKYYEYEYYHTSLDNLDFVRPANIFETLKIYLQVLELLDINIRYKNRKPNCEVQLNRYDLYPQLGGAMLSDQKHLPNTKAILNLLFYSDGGSSLFQIAQKTNINIDDLAESAKILEKADLIEPFEK